MRDVDFLALDKEGGAEKQGYNTPNQIVQVLNLDKSGEEEWGLHCREASDIKYDSLKISMSGNDGQILL